MLYETHTEVLSADFTWLNIIMDGQMKKWIQRVVIVLLMFPFMLVSTISMAQTSNGKKQIIVDAGHGGTDTGVKLSDKYYEKDITLSIATMLKKELEKSGNIQVLLTRISDKNISLSERMKAITTSNSYVFVGIHVNGGYGKESSGYELYFPGFASVTAGQVNSREILEDMAKNKYLNDSVRLAQLIQRNLETVFPRKSRGLRNAPLVIFKGLQTSAVVVEIGFAGNQEDKKKMMDENVRSAVARALSKSIREF
jgi:N-acetylmuramoyl-L-alanine amidase